MNGTVSMRYFDGPFIDQHLAAQNQSGDVAYSVGDHLGSITETTDAVGVMTAGRRYDPWGGLSAGGETSGYAFTGRTWDSETGLYYYRARYYAPDLAAFISEDPIRLYGGINLYAYTGNEPLGRFDPLGLDWIEYTGQLLTLYAGDVGDRSKRLKWCKATSGQPGYQTPNAQVYPNYGPVPEGDYRINMMQDPARAVTFTNGVANAATGVQVLPPGNPAWGTWRARLEKVNTRNPTDRDNFYLHDSNKGHTLGCIETCSDLYQSLVDYHNQGLKYLPVKVRYTGNSTNGGTGR